MKTKLSVTAALFLLSAICNKNVAQNVNTSLSNLKSPTKINASLVPDKDNNHNIGNLSKAWKNIYLDSALYFGGTRFLACKLGTANDNTAVGLSVLNSNTSGQSNTGLGFKALYSNTSGLHNTATGYEALYNNTSGYYNTATGYSTLLNNITGSLNVALGVASMLNNTEGSSNAAIGVATLLNNTTGGQNTAAGMNALFSNTTGYSNIAVGTNALHNSSLGHNLVAVGDSALFNQSVTSNSLYENTALGSKTLYSDTYGYANTAVGYNAGYNITNGSNNTFTGTNANCNSFGSINNSTALGHAATVTASNHVVIGNSSVTSIGGYVNWSNLSDGRVKKNIRQNVPGLAFINKLQPITYNLDLDAADKILNVPIKDKDGKIIQSLQFDINSRKAKEQIVYTGFVAQDVEKVAKSLNYDFSGVDKPDNANTLYGLRYSDFVVPLVKAVQELSKINDDKESEISTLKEQLDNQQKQIDELKSMIVGKQSALNSEQLTINNSASIQQNIPNPFSNTTTINYSLPAKFISAKIIITDKNGSALKTITLSNNTGSVNVDAATLSSGAYQYSLYINEHLITTKQMIILK